jgi:putative transcriptional regulator
MSDILLKHQFLLAMPNQTGTYFGNTITYVCEHNPSGAMGIVINRPLDMDLSEIFEQLSLQQADAGSATSPILRGGPVQMEHGFVIHDSTEKWETTAAVTDSINVTTSRDILSAMAAGHGPQRAVVALGYAGWGAGQLEAEIAANAWLNAPASSDILFNTPFEERWQRAAELLGVDLMTISTEAGHA